MSGFAYDLEALEATAFFFLEEKRKGVMTSITQLEALENCKKNKYDAEENEQETPGQQETRKEINSGTAYSKKTSYPLAP